MSRNASRLVWFRFEAHGQTWRVVLVPRLVSDRDGQELYGLTTYRRRLVEIAAWQPWDDLCETTLHEMMHVAGYSAMRVEGDEYAEERYISRAEGPLLNIVSRFGFRFPMFPRGFDDLRAMAIDARSQA